MSFEMFVGLTLLVSWAFLPGAVALSMTLFDDDQQGHH